MMSLLFGEPITRAFTSCFNSSCLQGTPQQIQLQELFQTNPTTIPPGTGRGKHPAWNWKRKSCSFQGKDGELCPRQPRVCALGVPSIREVLLKITRFYFISFLHLPPAVPVDSLNAGTSTEESKQLPESL